jgi:hypothetical protein
MWNRSAAIGYAHVGFDRKGAAMSVGFGNRVTGGAARAVLTMAATLAALCVGTMEARAAIVISSGATKNMSCVDHVCTATAADAVLNVGTIRSGLATANVKVATGTAAADIVVAADLSWASARILTLDSRGSIGIDAAVTVTGKGGLALVTNDHGSGGALAFGGGGHVQFTHANGSLSIDGVAYRLVGTVKQLGTAIAAKPSGHFALAVDYDASGDGIYAAAPVAVALAGVVEGLGNVISHLAIASTESSAELGLFVGFGPGCTICEVRDLGLSEISIAGGDAAAIGGIMGVMDSGTIENSFTAGSLTGADGALVGGIVGAIEAGTVSHSWAAGTAKGGSSASVGGVVGYSNGGGTILFSHASVAASAASGAVGGLAGQFQGALLSSYATGGASAGSGSDVGGLVGVLLGGVSTCYATGDVSGGPSSYAGGLIGNSAGHVTNCMATGRVTSGTNSNVGGLNGTNSGDTAGIGDSYSTGPVSGGAGSDIGGLVGADGTNGTSLSDTYWDTTTSGIKRGAGNIVGDPHITGKTTAALRARLPAGFSTKIWAESASILDGLPHLIGIAPP